MNLRLIGDIHNNVHVINDLLTDYLDYDLNIQLGDFGIGYGAEWTLNDFNSNKFKILSGNHDNYSLLNTFPHNLGKFGFFDGIFFISGAANHGNPKFIWESIELNLDEREECLKLWNKVCNDIKIVLSHDGPRSIVSKLLKKEIIPTITNTLLDELFKIHQPRYWFFGHHHKNVFLQENETYFHCLGKNKEFSIKI